MNETWKPIPEYEGLYEVSDQGRVKSIARLVKQGGHDRRVHERIRKTYTRASGHLQTSLSKAGVIRSWEVHVLVMLAFVGPRPAGMEVRHLNGNPADNRLSNLRYGTRAENVQDAIAHGTAWEQSKSACPRGHRYDGANLVRRRGRNGYLYRLCRACERASGRGLRRSDPAFSAVADEIYARLMGEAPGMRATVAVDATETPAPTRVAGEGS